MRIHMRSRTQNYGWSMSWAEVESYSSQRWQWIMLTSWKDTKMQTLWSKQVNTVNKIKHINLNKQLPLLPWQRNSHAIKNSCRGLGGHAWLVSAEKQHLIRAVAHHIPHHDTYRNSAWGLTPPEPGFLSQQHNHTGMRANNSVLPAISLQHTHTYTHGKYAVHQCDWKKNNKISGYENLLRQRFKV